MINIDRCLHGMKNIVVEGLPDNKGRLSLIETALNLILANPKEALRKGYLGIKNYAGFGDQRHDGPYGTGPTHGSIVFSIERTHDGREIELGDNKLYLLECVRDAGVLKFPQGFSGRIEIRNGNLCRFLESYSEFTKCKLQCESLLNAITVSSQNPKFQGEGL